jgi:hypothetical protein
MRTMITILMMGAAILVWGPGNAVSGPINSANGFGATIPDDYGRAMGVGGAGVADTGSIGMLVSNPALLTTFPTHTYVLGTVYDRSTASYGGIEQADYAKLNGGVFRLVFPVVHGLTVGWGLSPLTLTDASIGFAGDTWDDTVKTTGGLTMSSFGAGVSLWDRVRLGATFNYTFGMIQEEWSRVFDDPETYGSLVTLARKKHKGYGTSFGIIISLPAGMSVGGGYTTKTELTRSSYVRPGSYSNEERLTGTDTANLPARWRVGLASRIGERFTAMLDYEAADWEGAAESAAETALYANSSRIGGGIRYVPSTSTIRRSYLRSLPLSLGARYGVLPYRSYPSREDVVERSISAGIDFPIKDELGVIVTTFEFGERGDKGTNGWEESFLRVGVTLIGRIK